MEHAYLKKKKKAKSDTEHRDFVQLQLT